ncbi:MAG TPA: hypothetical protein PKI32_03235 [Opitutales bacterium]|nr:hypothetical protein [Opitutales bacterium]
MKSNTLSPAVLALVLTFAQTASLHAHSGGTGTSSDPYTLDSSDQTMDSGYYLATQAVKLNGGYLAKVGESRDDVHLTVDRCRVSASGWVFGDKSGSEGFVTVSGSGADLVCPSLSFLTVGNKGTGSLTVRGGASAHGGILLLAGDNYSKGSVRVTGKGSLLVVHNCITTGRGEGSIVIEDGALVRTGGSIEYPEAFSNAASGADWAVRLDSGYIAVAGNLLALKSVDEIDRLYHFETKKNGVWTPTSVSQLNVDYIDASGESYIPGFQGRVNLSGFTLITSAAEEPAYTWADVIKSTGDNWYVSSWLGWFYGGNAMNGWIFNYDHGYLYINASSSRNAAFIWDASAGKWWFTSKDYYPFMYDYTDAKWCYFTGGSRPNRRFYDYSRGAVVTESELHNPQ